MVNLNQKIAEVLKIVEVLKTILVLKIAEAEVKERVKVNTKPLKMAM
jgi:hypothetical protein